MNTRLPHSSPFTVLVNTAALMAYVALPCSASGKPSTIVAAAELAPGIPNSMPVMLSPVVLPATTAIQNTTPRYGSEKYCMKPNSITRPVVAPAAGMIPISMPYNVPAMSAVKASIRLQTHPPKEYDQNQYFA